MGFGSWKWSLFALVAGCTALGKIGPVSHDAGRNNGTTVGSTGVGPGGGSGTGGTGSGTGGVVQPPPPTDHACSALGTPGEWENITPAGVITTHSIVADPFDSGTIWLGTAPDGLGANPAHGNGGLYKSTNCGAASSWTHVSTGANGTEVDKSWMWSMIVDPTDKGTVYVIGAYGPQGLWKSTNGGVDWVQLFPATSEFAKTVPYNFVGSITMDPSDHLHLMVGTHGNCAAPYMPSCVAESTNGGTSWKIVNMPGSGWEEQTGPYLLNASSFLYASLFNGMTLFDNHGASYVDVTPSGVQGATGGEYTHRPLYPAADGTYYLPSYNQGGLLRSTDGGRTWSRVSGSPAGSYLLGIALGSDRIFLGDSRSNTYSMAYLSDLSKWQTLKAPPAPQGLGPSYLEYDEAHHLLYSSNFEGLAWRMVVP